MTDTELLELAIAMRAQQKAYFRTRSKDDLIKSKDLESRFDKATQVWAAKQFPEVTT